MKSGIISPRRMPRRAEHRVLLAKALDGGEHLARVGRHFLALRLGRDGLAQQLLVVGQELVQRRVDQADDDGQSAHRLEDALEVTLLKSLELGDGGVEALHRRRVVRVQCLAGVTPFLGARRLKGNQDCVTHDLEALALAEHVLRPAQANALRAVAAGLGGLLGLVGVGPHLQPSDVVGPAQDLLQLGLVLEAGRRSSAPRRRRPRRSCRRG
jgi:hypothetical protein